MIYIYIYNQHFPWDYLSNGLWTPKIKVHSFKQQKTTSCGLSIWVLSIARQKAHLGHELFLAPQNWNGNLEPFQAWRVLQGWLNPVHFRLSFFRFQSQPSIFYREKHAVFPPGQAWMPTGMIHPWRKLRIAYWIWKLFFFYSSSSMVIVGKWYWLSPKNSKTRMPVSASQPGPSVENMILHQHKSWSIMGCHNTLTKPMAYSVLNAS